MKLSERIRSGHGISGNLADAAEALEDDLAAERSRCQDLTARLDRARTDYRVVNGERDYFERGIAVLHLVYEMREHALQTRHDRERAIAHRQSARLSNTLAGQSRFHRRAQAAESRAIKAEREAATLRVRLRGAIAKIPPGNLLGEHARCRPTCPQRRQTDTRTEEVTRGWAVFLAERDAQRSARGPASVGGWKVGDACEARDVYGTWHAATIVDLSTLHGVEEVVECSLANGRKAFVDVGGLRRPAPEATREWAVGDACEFIQSGDGDDAATWEPGTIVGFADGGIVIDPIPPRKYFSWRLPEGVRRPIPPTAMESTIEGGRGLDMDRQYDHVFRAAFAPTDDRGHGVAAMPFVRALCDDHEAQEVRIADLERRLREAETERGALNVSLDSARRWRDRAIDERDAERARAERAEEKVRRVMERCREVIGNGFATGTQRAVLAADILAIIGEESAR